MHSEEAKVYSAILVAALVLAVILLFFIISLLKQRRKNSDLHREKINVEITTLEAERKRVARDLHDEIAMMLSVAKLQLSTLENQPVADQALILKACNHIDNSLLKIREIISDLLPTALSRKGFEFAVRELLNNIDDAKKWTIDYSVSEPLTTISETASIHLYRVIQEILHNSLKHSNATKLSVDLQNDAEYFKMMVADNGKGFNEKAMLEHSKGLGLKSIMSRIEILNGDLYLDTAENKGVTYTIEIPLSSVL